MSVTVEPVGWQFYVRVDRQIWGTYDTRAEADAVARELKREAKSMRARVR